MFNARIIKGKLEFKIWTPMINKIHFLCLDSPDLQRARRDLIFIGDTIEEVSYESHYSIETELESKS